MCGIAGYYTSRSTKSSDNIQWLTNTLHYLSHRGPDDSGIYLSTSAHVGLSHTRLSILDTSSAGKQPMSLYDDSLVITFNGEIYNYRSIRQLLEANGYAFDTLTDTEVLLSAYHYYCCTDSTKPYLIQVKNFLSSLNGIFSFAIWDHSRSTLLLARDRFGVKPLYFSTIGTATYFASEIKALQPTAIQLDAQAIDNYLSYLWSPGASTPASNVKKLEPGFATILSQNHNQTFKWYSHPHVQGNQPRYSYGDAALKTREHLHNAVQRQLVSDVPVGAFLSGGLDSSAVVAFARLHLPRLDCFTINITGHQNHDLPYARQCALHLGVELHEIDVTPESFVSSLERMIITLEEPTPDPACVNTALICEAARESGFKVLLSGVGGDDLFSGYRRHVAASNDQALNLIPSFIKKNLFHLSHSLSTHNTLTRRIRKLCSGLDLSRDERLVNYFRWISRDDLSSLYTADFRSRLKPNASDSPFLDYLANLPPSVSLLEDMLHLDKRFFLGDHNLLYTDKMSMAHGVEVRVPFLDNELVNFSSHLPLHYKTRHGKTKIILRKAMEPLLQHNVIYRPKVGFDAPLRTWLTSDLRDWLHNILSETVISNRGIFNPLSVAKLLEANDKGQVDASYTLFGLACIELWCQHFIDPLRS